MSSSSSSSSTSIGHEDSKHKIQLIIEYCVNNLSSEVIHRKTFDIHTNTLIKKYFTEYWDDLNETQVFSENDINYNKTEYEYKLFSIPLQVFNIKTRNVRNKLKGINDDNSNNIADIVSRIYEIPNCATEISDSDTYETINNSLHNVLNTDVVINYANIVKVLYNNKILIRAVITKRKGKIVKRPKLNPQEINDVYNTLRSNLIRQQSTEGSTEQSTEGSQKTITLRFFDFFLFEFILLIVDLYHDYRHGYRNTTTNNNDFKDEIQIYLRTQKEKLKQEIGALISLIKNSNHRTTLDELNLSMIGLTEKRLIGDDNNEGIFNQIFNTSDVESYIYDTIIKLIESDSNNIKNNKNTNKRNNIINQNIIPSYKCYSDTKNKIGSNTGSKYISNNACCLKQNEKYNSDNIDVILGGTINENSKSVTASIFDGAAASGPGSSIKSAYYDGRMEYGSYDIKFTIDADGLGLQKDIKEKLQNHHLIFKSSFIEEDNSNSIIQKLDVERNYYKISDIDTNNIDTNNIEYVPTTERCNFKFMLFNREGKSESVVLNQEINNPQEINNQEYNGLLYNNIFPHNQNNNPPTINQGDFCYYIKTIDKNINKPNIYTNTNIPLIYGHRKAHCDFGQYLNGIINSGGYDNNPSFCNIGNIGCTPLPLPLPLQNQGNDRSENFAFLSLHGDKPAAALNLALLQMIRIADVNVNSHIMYASSNNNLFLTNCHGFVTNHNRIASSSESQSRKKQKTMGGNPNAEEQKKLQKVLDNYFRLCLEFKMPIEVIQYYNNTFGNFDSETDNKKTQLIKILQVVIQPLLQEEELDKEGGLADAQISAIQLAEAERQAMALAERQAMALAEREAMALAEAESQAVEQTQFSTPAKSTRQAETPGTGSTDGEILFTQDSKGKGGSKKRKNKRNSKSKKKNKRKSKSKSKKKNKRKRYNKNTRRMNKKEY